VSKKSVTDRNYSRTARIRNRVNPRDVNRPGELIVVDGPTREGAGGYTRKTKLVGYTQNYQGAYRDPAHAIAERIRQATDPRGANYSSGACIVTDANGTPIATIGWENGKRVRKEIE
jgi:hypothetical protein